MEAITDVSPAAVDAAFAEHGVDTIIHGHTHRPAVHQLEIDGRPRRRIVLGDWYEQGSVLQASPQGVQLSSLAALQLGTAHVCTPVTNAHLVCLLLPEKK